MHFANKDELPVELKCGLCGNPWAPDNAKACPTCDALYCDGCLGDHYLKDTKCPACREVIPDIAKLKGAPRPLRSMSERTVLVKCPNRPSSCWTGPWSQLPSHLKDCPHDPSKLVYVGDIAEELLCAICMNVLDSPVSAPCCEHNFCDKCISAALEKKAECPMCRAELSHSTLTEARQSLQNMLSHLNVYCTSKCGWKGEKNHLKAHLDICSERVVVVAPAPCEAALPAPVVATPTPVPVVDRAVPVPPAAVATPPAPAARATPPPAEPVSAAVQLTTVNYHPTVHESNSILSFFTMAHIKAPAAPPSAKRKDLQISAVMDISGSMGTEKMRMAKEALKFVVNELKPSDRFGLIAFDDKVEARLPLTDMNESGRGRAEAAITGLAARGGTNLSSGLFAGIAQVRDMPFATARTVRHVDAARKTTSPPPVAAPAGGIMSRLMSLTARKPSAKPAPTPVPAPDEFGCEDDIYVAPEETYIAPFDVVVKYNLADYKRDGNWMTRYTFELAGPLPPRVAHVSVKHPTHGKIVLRGPTTFGLMPSGIKDFEVEVTFSREINHAETKAIHITPDDDGLGQATVNCSGFGTVPTTRSRIVMLFTDGQANEGITDPGQLTAKTAEILAKMPEKDVTIVTFGFGSDHNGALLSLIAEKSQGTYYFVQDSSRLKEIFADCIGGLLSIMATNLTLTIKPALGVRIKEAMTQFPTTTESDGTMTVKIKDFFAEEERDVVVNLDVAPRSPCPAVPLVTWILTYEQAGVAGQQSVSAHSTAATVDKPFLGTPDARVDEQINRYRAAEAMAVAQKLAEEGKVHEANMALRGAAQAVQCSASAATPYSAMLQADLARCVVATENSSVWAREGQKQVSRMKSTHAQQRCNYVAEADEDDDMCAYVTSAKVAMRKNARS